MPDTLSTFDQLADAARRALSRGDREGVRVSLTAALRASDAPSALAAAAPDHLFRLASLCQDAGLDGEAEHFFRDAVAAAERMHGEDDCAVVPALASLGTALAARGAFAEAEPFLTRALAISERHLGEGHQDLNVLFTALSRVYLKQGAFARAEPLLERLLALKLNKGEDHPEVATVLASLTAVRQALGNHEGAEQLARRVLQIRERTLPPNHFAIASALELLADACAARGNVAEALQRYERALSIREQTLGIGHPSLRVLRERIADLQLQGTEPALGDAASGVALLSPPTLSTARLGGGRPPVQRAMIGEAALGERDEAQHQQAFVVPAETGALSLQEELRDIERDLESEAAEALRPSPLRAAAAALWIAVLHRRMQAALIGAGALTLLVAAMVVQPRASASTGDESTRLDAGAPSHQSAPIARAASLTNDTSARAADTSITAARADGSSTYATAPLEGAGAAQRRAPERPSASEHEPDVSVLVARGVHPPVANIVVSRADSIARASALAPKIASDSFSKQFWTRGIDSASKSLPSGEGTLARLRGPMPQPVYPEFLRKNGVEGEVAVQFVVDESGRPDPTSFEVLRSPHEAMTEAVRRVVAQMRFDPALSGGPAPKPRSELVRISFLFSGAAK